MSTEHGTIAPEKAAEFTAPIEAATEAERPKTEKELFDELDAFFETQVATAEALDGVMEQYLDGGHIVESKNGVLFPSRFDQDDEPLAPFTQKYNSAIIANFLGTKSRLGEEPDEATVNAVEAEATLSEKLLAATTPEAVLAIAETELRQTHTETYRRRKDNKEYTKLIIDNPGTIAEDTREGEDQVRHFRPKVVSNSRDWITADLVNHALRHASKPETEPAPEEVEPPVAETTEVKVNLDNLQTTAKEREHRREVLISERFRRTAEKSLGLPVSDAQKAERQHAIVEARERFRAAETVATEAKNTAQSEFIAKQSEGLSKFLAPEHRGGYRIDANPQNPVESARLINAMVSRLGRESTFFEERKEDHGKGVNIVARAFRTRDPNIVVVERWNMDSNQFLGVVALKGGSELVEAKADIGATKMSQRARGHIRNITHALRGSHSNPEPIYGMKKDTWKNYDIYADSAHDVPKVPITNHPNPNDNGQQLLGRVDRLRTMAETFQVLGYSEEAINKISLPRTQRKLWYQLLAQRQSAPTVTPKPTILTTAGHPYQPYPDRSPRNPYQPN